MKKLFILLVLLPCYAGAQTITTFAGCGIGNDSVATSAELFYPHSVAVDKAGNMYIADVYGCRVHKVDPSGVITVYAGTGIPGFGGDGGPATAAMLFDPYGVTVDTNGNVYVADAGNNSIRIITPSGLIGTYAGYLQTPGYCCDGTPANTAYLYYPMGVYADNFGNVYIADAFNNRIRKVGSDGIITTVAGDGTYGYSGDGGPADSAALATPYDIVADNAGNFYIADFDNAVIRKVDGTGVISTYAGTNAGGYSGDGGPATAAMMSAPSGVTMDAAGNLYFSDTYNFVIRQVNTSGIINTVAGSGFPGYGGDGGPAAAAEFSEPAGLGIDQAGNIYIADDWNNRVRKLSTPGIVTTVAGENALFADGCSAINAELSGPGNIAVDNAGNVYLADYYNNRIRKFDAVTGVATTAAGSGIGGLHDGYSGDGGPATAANMYFPAAVVVDASGNIFVADKYNNRIREVNTAGIITTLAGNGFAGYSGDGGPGTDAEINQPSGVAVDAAGNVYICDASNFVIRMVNTAGIISTVAGNSSSVYSGDGGPATAAGITPLDVAVDAAGNIYIADGFNARIRKVDTAGIITTYAGTGVAGYYGEGAVATVAKLDYPSSIKVDAGGNVWFADTYNNRIRMINDSGIIYTMAGNGTAGYVGDHGPATVAELNQPDGVAVDGAGNVYIADANNYRIRKIGIPPLCAPCFVYGTATITIFPNPASAELNILSDSEPIDKVSISNMLGQQLQSAVYSSQSRVTVDISSLPAGIYFVKINNTEVRKFVKE